MDEVLPPPVAASWQKSSRSGGSGECVRVKFIHTHVLICDSKNPKGPVLQFTSEQWTAFLGRVQSDEFARVGLPD